MTEVYPLFSIINTPSSRRGKYYGFGVSLAYFDSIIQQNSTTFQLYTVYMYIYRYMYLPLNSGGLPSESEAGAGSATNGAVDFPFLYVAQEDCTATPGTRIYMYYLVV